MTPAEFAQLFRLTPVKNRHLASRGCLFKIISKYVYHLMSVPPELLTVIYAAKFFFCHKIISEPVHFIANNLNLMALLHGFPWLKYAGPVPLFASGSLPCTFKYFSHIHQSAYRI